MTALLSTALTLASVLGIWTAAAVATAPVLVCCIRSQARANARRGGADRREAWLLEASRR